jgi:hypothetical protein
MDMYMNGVTESQAVDILARFLPRSGESRLDVGRSADDSVLSGPAIIVGSVKTMTPVRGCVLIVCIYVFLYCRLRSSARCRSTTCVRALVLLTTYK